MAYLRIGRWLLLAWAVPVIGGSIGYWKTGEQDKRLAQTLAAGTFGIPVIAAGGIIGYQVSTPAALAGAALAGITAPLLLLQVIDENPYRKLLWACYLSLPGALYLYVGPYKEQPRLRRAAKTFAIGTAVVGVLAVAGGWMLLRQPALLPF